jgi:GT2 family glycosyltransferase
MINRDLMKVSVLVITHDRPDGLGQTLSGLAVQSHMPDEVIVIDNGSKLNCYSVIERYQTVLPLIYEWINERMVAAARNYAIEKSAGDILIFTDDDCVPEPEWVAGILVPFMNDAGIGEVGGKVISRQTKLNAVTLVGDSMYKFMMQHYEHGIDSLDTEVPYRAFFPTANAAFRRTVLSSLGGFDPSLSIGEDIDLSFRILRAGWKLVYSPAAVVRHKHRESIRDVLRQFWHYGETHPHLFKKYNLAPGKITFRLRARFSDSTRGSFITVHVPSFIKGCVYLNGLIGHCFIYAIMLLLIIHVFAIQSLIGSVLALLFSSIFLRRVYAHHVGILKLRFINVPFFCLDIISRASISLSGFLRGIKVGMLFIN